MVEITRAEDRYYMSIHIPLSVGEEFYDDVEQFYRAFSKYAFAVIKQNLKGELADEANDAVIDFTSEY